MTNPAERAIFLQAIDEENLDDRFAYLDSACGQDVELRASVEALLDAHDRPAKLLDQPIGDGSELVSTLPINLSNPVQHIGMQVGPYRLMEQIGEGGFGLVFVAQQERPVERKVALKIVKPGVGTQEVIARFEAERQAVAMMNHPNIAQVFDAGVTTDHRPYFVMELVRGLPITEFCDNHQIDVRKRLDLFTDVCAAVHHAHQKGVIHRDIKPSNVMVTLHDDKPVAKVIDFGVAKAIGQRLTDKTIYTRFFSMIGTPLYMSPEQAEMSGLDVDTRSDIYSLGVLMYEILAGATPFDRDRMDSAGLDELRRIIREEEPPRPSRRLTTLGASITTVSAARRMEPARLTSMLNGDLDWIVMKSLEKDRSRRYESAAALATDIKRFLQSEPIAARPPSRIYQFAKFARRHRAAIITASLVGIAMLIGTAGSLWQMSIAIDQRDRKDVALHQALIAKNEATAAKQQVEQFAKQLAESNMLVASGQAHADAGRWAAAARDYNAAVEIQPTYFLPRVQRALLYTRLRLWDEAAQDYAIALGAGAPTNQPQWWGVPALFLWTSHQNEAGKLALLCEEQLQEDVGRPQWLILRGLVACEDVPTSVSMAAFAKRAQKWFDDRQGPPPPFEQEGPPRSGTPRSGTGPDRPHFGPPGFPTPKSRDRDQFGQFHPYDDAPPGVSLYITGLIHLRAGEFDRAIELIEEAALDFRWPARYLIHAPLAMAYHHLGDAKQAQRSLDDSKLALSTHARQLLDEFESLPTSPWFDFVEGLQLNREASVLLTGKLPLEDPTLADLRTRSLELIDLNSQSTR